MVRIDIHFFSADLLPLILQFLKSNGTKIVSHRAIPFNEVRNYESLCPKNCVIFKVKYDV